MHPQLKNYQSGFTSVKDEAKTLVADVDTEALSARPDRDTWSVLQCIDHLNTAGWLLLQSMEDAIQQGQEEGPYGEPPFEYGFVSRWFIYSMDPDSGWTFTAPSAFEPEAPSTLHPGETISEFMALQDQFAERVVASEGLDLRRIRLPSPAVPLLRISLGAWFEATLAHEWRHLEQARRALLTRSAS